MSSAPAQLFVAVEDGTVYVRVVGRATYASSVDLKSLFESQIGKGRREIAVDLRQCPLMDSTFIGLLAAFGMQLRPGPGSGISLYCGNERIRGMLSNLGVNHLFIICEPDEDIPSHRTAQPAERGSTSHAELQRTCLEAHRKLMEINPENVARFKDVARFLAEDLKKAESGSDQNMDGDHSQPA